MNAQAGADAGGAGAAAAVAAGAAAAAGVEPVVPAAGSGGTGAAPPALSGLGAPLLPGSGAPGAQDGAKPNGPAEPGKPVAPALEVKVKLPERVSSEALSGAFDKAMKEGGLKGEHAQQIADALGSTVEQLGQSYIEAERARIIEMDQALRLDPALGGANLATTQANMRRYFTSEDKDGALVKLLESNPAVYYDKAMVRLLSWAGSQTKDDSVSGANGSITPGKDVPFDQLPLEDQWARSFPNTPYPGTQK